MARAFKTIRSEIEGAAPRRKMEAPAEAVAELARRKAESREIEDLQDAERKAVQRDAAAYLATVEREAKAKGEEPRRDGVGPLHLARDGLVWAVRKGTIDPVHYDAGLRFRPDYELANGTGVSSCLADPGGHTAFNPHTAGPTQAMLMARGRVKDALAGLGTPLLHGYVVLVAGEGAMLTDPRIGGPKGADDHKLVCRIAFDLLARHYGMIR